MEPLVSVIVPVYNGAATLAACLGALRASSFADWELIVVDDASDDGSGAIAKGFAPDALLVNATNLGHTEARNRAVARARGRILFFTDADVTVAPDTLARVAAWLADPGLGAVVGLYEPRQPHPGLPTAYKNAWIHHTYARAADEIDWFFTAVGAVRRDAFDRVGGFGPRYRREGGGGDVEFGRRLHAAGVRIRLDKDLRVTHHRRFTLADLLGNDYRRAAGWTRMVHASPGGLRAAASRGIANVRLAFAAGSALALAAAALVPLALVSGPARVALGSTLALAMASDHAFLAFAARTFGPGRAAGFAALGLVDRLVCGAGMVVGLAGAVRERWRAATATRSAMMPR